MKISTIASNIQIKNNNVVPKMNIISFEGAASRKLIEKIKISRQLKKMNVTFAELVNAYKEIGYDVYMKRGSHAVVPLGNGFNIPLPIPHKSKNVTVYDLKRFRYILDGDFEKAMKA